MQIKNMFEILRLWAHEFMRVFYDRLVTVQDREFLLDLVIAQVDRVYVDKL